jgi:hypothetical protein
MTTPCELGAEVWTVKQGVQVRALVLKVLLLVSDHDGLLGVSSLDRLPASWC